MEQVTFETNDKKDVNLLIAIAEKLGIKKHVISNTGIQEKKKKGSMTFLICMGNLTGRVMPYQNRKKSGLNGSKIVA